MASWVAFLQIACFGGRRRNLKNLKMCSTPHSRLMARCLDEMLPRRIVVFSTFRLSTYLEYTTEAKQHFFDHCI